MGFQQGLSGLNAAAKALDAIGNNVSNAGTVGFKSADAQFADVFAASLSGGGAAQIGIGASVSNVTQSFSQGNITVSSNPLDVAINGGGFFRMLSTAGTTTYTRNGQFQVDKNGYIVNSAGSQLTGYLANATGVIVPSTPAAIQINTSDLQPIATGKGTPATGLKVGLNLDSRNLPPTQAIAGSLTGNAAPGTLIIGAGNNQFTATINGIATNPATVSITQTTYASASALASAVAAAVNAALPGGTSVSGSVNGSGQVVLTASPGGTGSAVTLAGSGAANLLSGAGTAVAGSDNFSATNPLTYNSSTSATVYDSLGNPHILAMYFVKAALPNQWNLYTNLDGGTPTTATTLNFSSSGAPSPIGAFTIAESFPITTGGLSPLGFNLDLSTSTQYGNIFGVNSITQDGYASGRLSGLNVSPDGTVQGRYSNGQTRNLAQVVLVTFKNPNGLASLGGNQWADTATSGQALIGAPGSGANGVLQSAAIEESNVDLTKELVDMITQQRAYQSSAQTIKTQDSVLQTLVNLR